MVELSADVVVIGGRRQEGEGNTTHSHAFQDRDGI